jgi:hypothetical protein
VTPEQRLLLAENVGRELVRLGLEEHLAKVRSFYADTRAGRPLRMGGWIQEHVIELAKILRVPPYEHAYPVRPRLSSCGCSSPQPLTALMVGPVSKLECGACGVVWLEVRDRVSSDP